MKSRSLRLALGTALLAALAPSVAHAGFIENPRRFDIPLIFLGDPLTVALDKSVGISVDARDQERRNLGVLDGIVGDVRNYTGGVVNFDPNAVANASAYARVRKWDFTTGGSMVVGANASFSAGLSGSINVGASASARAEAGYNKVGSIACRILGKPCRASGYYGLVDVRDFEGKVQTLVRQDAPDPLTVARDFIVYMPDPRPLDQMNFSTTIAGANLNLYTVVSGWFSGNGRASINALGGDASFHGRAHLVASATGTGMAGPATAIFSASLTALDDTINTTNGGRAFVDASVTLAPKRKDSAWNMCASYGLGATVERGMSYLSALTVATPGLGVAQPFRKESNGFWLPPSFSPAPSEECVLVP